METKRRSFGDLAQEKDI